MKTVTATKFHWNDEHLFSIWKICNGISVYSDIYLDEEGTKDAVGDGIHSALHDKRKESSYHLDFSNGASKSGFAFANHETYESGALF